jgi:hypothetical protein
MLEIGSRQRNLPPPPHVVFDDLIAPRRSGIRSWLNLLDDEIAPQILDSQAPMSVTWSSLWPRRPDARLHFELRPDREGAGTDLRWTLMVDEPEPDAELIGHLRKRVNTLLFADLRYSYGQ